MDKKREILVVERGKIFDEGYFQGFVTNGIFDFSDKILTNYLYLERNNELENNVDYLQVIPYVWVVNKEKGIFVYKRAVGAGEYKEERHIDKYSAGIGGHIDRDTEENSANPVLDAADRELKEELIMENYPSSEFIGYINDDSDIYNAVHFAVVALAETSEENIKPNDGMKSGRFYSIEEFESLMKDKSVEVENWTRLSWPFVKTHLTELKQSF